MKKFLILFSILLFSFSFSETYNVKIPKNLKMSSAELSQNNSQIEKAFSDIIASDSYSAANMRKAFGITENTGTKEEELFIFNVSIFMQGYLSATKFHIDEISYSDADTAAVTINVISPDIDKYVSDNEKTIQKRAEQYFKDFSGKTVQQVDKDTNNQDKYVPVLMAALLRSVSDNMKDIKNNTVKKNVVNIHKKNGVWALDETAIGSLLYSPLF